MVAFFLCIQNTEIIKCLIINLPHIFQSLGYLFLATFQVDVDEGKRGILKIEADGHRSLVPCHSGESGFHLTFAKEFN